MIRKIAGKVATLFYRLHLVLRRFSNSQKSVTPYRLNYKVVAGKPVILHVNGNFVVGGTSQLIADIIEKTSDSFTHHIIVPAHPEPIPYQPVSLCAFPLSKLDKLYEWLRENKPALVHIHYWVRPMHRYYDFGTWYAAIFRMCEELKLKVIQNINVPTHPYASSAVVHNVFVSNYVRDEFNDQSSVPSSVIYPGSDISFFNQPADHELPDDSIGMVYRLDPDKLNPEAIELFIQAVKKKPSLSCYIIGGGTYLRYYKQRVNKEGLTDRFTFTGYVAYSQLPTLYKKLGLVVAPVHDESFGQVTPFAMGMGLPVAGYDTGALKEILGSADTLVPTGDSDALVKLIVDLMEDRKRRRSLGQVNQERARREFSLEEMIPRYKTLYESHVS